MASVTIVRKILGKPSIAQGGNTCFRYCQVYRTLTGKRAMMVHNH